jgi:pyrroloquinoline-quinone synthase
MDLFARLEAAGRRWDVLRHPFYRRWECGQLTRQELGVYAGEYHHAVAALAQAAAQAAPLAGSAHAAEEADHVELWDAFAEAVGADRKREPLPETRACVEAWTSAGDPLGAVSVLYAVESAQPEIARTKLAGLVEHYGFSAGSPETTYFTIHTARDVEHAAHSRRLLEDRATDGDAARLASLGEAALKGNWTLLDGVDRAQSDGSVKPSA